MPYPQYGAITQTNTDGRLMRTHTIELRAQRPFTSGASFLIGYAWNHERRQEWFDDIAQYRVLQSNGEDGWEWRPHAIVPTHRVTAALTVQVPVGRDQRFGVGHAARRSISPSAAGSTQRTARYYSGRPLLFNTSYVVSGNPSSTIRRATAGSTRASSPCRTASRRAATRGTSTGLNGPARS